jgi:hypothetical protein
MVRMMLHKLMLLMRVDYAQIQRIFALNVMCGV